MATHRIPLTKTQVAAYVEARTLMRELRGRLHAAERQFELTCALVLEPHGVPLTAVGDLDDLTGELVLEVT